MRETTVGVTVEDDDERGVEVSATALSVPEGDSRTYTVVLESQPTGPVTVTPSVSGSADVTVSPSELTFTTQSWDQAQTVTVSAAQDADAANDEATVSHTVSGGDYGSVTASDVGVTVADDDRGVEVSATALSVPEGDSRTYTVVLSSQPDGPVTVTPTVSGSTDVTVSPATLTFTTQSWDQAQTVTVSAAQDADSANDEAAVSHTVSGGDYGSVTASDVEVTVEDDERGVEISSTALPVPEGQSRTYTVVLESQPTGPVTVTPTVSGSADVTVSPSELTFTTQSWDQAQTVTVSAAQDADAANDEAAVSHTVSGGDYGSVTASDVGVTVADDDDRGVEVSATALSVPEGDSRTYTVVLSSQPDGSVTVTPSVPGSADVTVSPSELTFTTQSWDQAQTVTVSAAQDADSGNDEATVSHTVSGGDYGSVTAPDVAVTAEDDDERGIEVSATALTVPEGDSRTYTVVLESQPTGPVTVTPTVSGSADVTVSPSELTFTTQSWDQAQTVTVSAAQDADAANDEATVSHTVSGGDYGSVTASDVGVTVADDDDRGVEVSATALPMPEGDSRTYTVVLSSQPDGPVTVTPTVSGSADVTVSPSELTFTTQSWDQAQTVTVSAAQDADAANDEATVSHTVSGGDYGSVTASDVEVTVADDDDRGVEVSSTALSVPEGDSRTYTVVLSSQPDGPVTVTPTVSGSADVTVSPSELTFTTQSWDQAQTATVSAAQDADSANDEAAVSHTVSGGDYGSVTASDVEVTVADDDDRGVEVSSTALSVPEGDSRTYTVVLSSQPDGPVTVTPTVSGSPDVTVSPAELTFTAQTWNQEQSVTVAAARDDDAANDEAVIAHAVSGGDYESVSASAVAVTIEDEDEASTAVALSVSPGTVDEDGGATAIEVTGTLNAATRTRDTTVRISVSPGTASNDDFAAVPNFTLTIAAGRNSATATFALTPVDDDIDEDDETVRVTGTAQGFTVRSGTVTVKDDDERGVEVSATALSVPEGDSRTYTVVLKSQPTGAVTVIPSVSGSPDVTVSPAELTFTAQTWNQEQSVTVAAARDDDAADDEAVIAHAVSGGDYGSVTAADVVVTVRDPDDPSTAVALSVSPGTVDEDEGATAIEVTGTLNAATRTRDTTVRVSVSPGTASNGDFAAVPDFTLTIAAGRKSGTATFVLVPVDDSIDEKPESIVVNGTSPDMAVHATTLLMVDADPLPKAWTARFGRTVADQILEAVDTRIAAQHEPGVEVRIAGQRIGGSGAYQPETEPGIGNERSGRIPTGQAAEETGPYPRHAVSRELTERDLLTGSSFALTADTDSHGLVSLWGRGAITRFTGRDDKITLDGELTTGMAGADRTWGDATAGLLVSHSRGAGSYRGKSDSGSISSSLNGIFPWGSYAPNERLTVWGVAGYGVGELELLPDDNAPLQAGLDHEMLAAGVRGALVQGSESSGMELASKADWLYVRTSTDETGSLAATKAKVTRLRLALESSWAFHPENGATITPSLEFGGRHDGGDAESGLGVDVGAGLSWVHPASGVSAELSGRGLLTHTSRSFREFGISGSFAWDRDPGSDRGPSLSLRHTAGSTVTEGTDALLGPPTMEGLGQGGLQNRRLDLNMGYGFSALGDRFTSTPGIGVGLADGGRDFRLGWRLARRAHDGRSIDFSIEALRRESASEDTPAEHEVRFGIRARY